MSGKIKVTQVHTDYDLVPANVAADKGKVLTAGASDRTGSWQNPNSASKAYAAGSTSVGALAYNGTTPAAGELDGSGTNPSGTTRLNYSGYFYATKTFNPQYITADIAECYIRDCQCEVGDLIAISDGKTKLATLKDKMILGWYSDTYGYLMAGSDQDVQDGKYIPIALVGRIQAKIKGKGKSGDYITPTNQPGICKCTRYKTRKSLGQLLYNKDTKEISLHMIYIIR